MLIAFDYPGRFYARYYVKYFSEFWDNITPEQYLGLLLFVSLCGYILMKSAK